MKAKRFGRTRVVARISAIALLAGALAFAATVHVNPAARLPKVILTAANDFSITGTITDWPLMCTTSPAAAASLYPGTERCLTYTVHNPLQVPISVLSLSAAIDTTVTTTVPAACTLDLGDASLSGTPLITVPAGGGTNTASAPIRLTDNGQNQDVCKGFTFALKYSGTATYTEIYSTSTAVTSSVNPSNVGQSVTYTATVSGIQGATQDPMPNSPTGTVDFKDGATTICSNVAVSSATGTTSTAQCTPTPAYAAPGTHPITAVFTDDPQKLNFATSTSSPALSQVIQSLLPGTSTILTSAPNPSLLGSSVTLTATVTKASGSDTPAGTVSFYEGAPPSGTLLGSGTLNASAVATFVTSDLPAGADSLYAVYNGNGSYATSTSQVISQIVIAQPAACVGSFTLIVANPASPTVNGTNGNDFIYAVGTRNYTINGAQGNDCIQAGDGNNTITDGNGNDVIVAGNGNNTISVGNGNSTIVAGNGTNTISAGNLTNSITVGNGSNNKIAVGNGANSITVGTGASNIATVGNGNNTLRIQTPGNHDTLVAGNGTNTAYLGGGTFNKFTGGKPRNVCHLPSLPPSVYSDTLTNCTAVTP